MKSAATFALVVLVCVPAKAQFGGMGGMGGRAQAQSIELELLEMEQEADKTALKEALLIQARQGMKPIHGTDSEKKQLDEDVAALRDFIARKREAITARASQLTKTRVASRRVPAAPAVSPADQKASRQELVEKIQRAQIDIQLLEAEVLLLRTPLDQAIDALAKAEVAASKDEAERPKAEAARKEYDKIKANVVEQNKRLELEKLELQSMNQTMGMGGMGGGFR
jgi:hypothetical protein